MEKKRSNENIPPADEPTAPPTTTNPTAKVSVVAKTQSIFKVNQNCVQPEQASKRSSRFFIENGSLWRKVPDKETGEIKSHRICFAFRVLEVLLYALTDTYAFIMEFQPFGTHQPTTTEIPVSDLEIKKLQANHFSKGEPFYSKTALPHIIAYILEELSEHHPVQVFPVLGWAQKNGERVFICKDFAITKDGKDRSMRYSCEKLLLSSAGTEGEAISGLNGFLPGSTPLQTAASSGLAAPLIELLNINEVDTIVLHLNDTSTAGKSTAGSLAVSMFSNPEKSQTGLNQSCFQTFNHMISILSGNHGYSVCVDEIGKANYVSDPSFIYNLASGMEKGRKGDKPDVSGLGTQIWRTVIISTGEISIVSDKLFQGARIRIIELSGQWTRDAEEAESLMAFLANQHGIIGLRFVEELLRFGEEKVKEEYNGILAEMKPLASPDKLSQRLTGTLAIVVTAASLANKLLGLEIDYKQVMDFLLHTGSLESVQSPLADQVIEHLKTKVQEFDDDVFAPRTFRKNRSGKMESSVTKQNGAIGKIIWKDTNTPESLVLTKKAYEEIVSEHFDVPIATRALKEHGFILCEANGKTKKGEVKTSVFKKIWIRGAEQVAIAFHADKLSIRSDDTTTVEVNTPIYDSDGVANGTRKATYKARPEIIEVDGTSSYYDSARLPFPDPPSEEELAFGEATAVKEFDQYGHPVEEDDDGYVIVCNGKKTYMKGEPFDA